MNLECQVCFGKNPACEFCGGTGSLGAAPKRKAPVSIAALLGKSVVKTAAPVAASIKPDAELIAWAAKQTWSSFATDVAAKAIRYGRLTDNQRASLTSMRDKCAAKEKAVTEATPERSGFEEVVAILGRIAASGNVFPKLRLRTPNDAPVNIALRTFGHNAGQVRVFAGDTPCGEIKDGTWRTPRGWRITPAERADLDALFDRLIEDPKAVCASYGYATGHCALCGRPLSNPESVAMGIGPICAGKGFV